MELTRPAMQIQFLGAVGTVTGSKYLVRHRGGSLLVDCGLFQGYKQLRLRNWAPLPFHPGELGAVVLTHAHIDHSGWLPLLVKQGFRGPVYCHPATADLCRVLLTDAGGLQEEQAAFANRHGLSKHVPALPLYTRADAERCLEQLEPVGWHRDWQPLPGLGAQLAPVGHMLGASTVRLDDGRRSLLFSGDVGRANDLLLPAPPPPPECDYLVVESTYGDRLHAEVDVLQQLADVINRTAARGGTLVIPAFAVGRAQQLLHAIHLLKQRGSIHHLPVYLNSPMAAEALHLYQRHAALLRLAPDESRALQHAATVVRTPAESRELNARRGPMILIAGSGMATGGRVVHHLEAFAPHHRNTILLAGFQAGGTRGAALAAGAQTIRIHRQDIPVRAEVAQIDSLSGHADAAELQAWLAGLPRPPRRTFVTHGEPAAADAMRIRLERNLHWDTCVPEHLGSYSLD
jgi:metallo-beta-lactamase family protein